MLCHGLGAAHGKCGLSANATVDFTVHAAAAAHYWKYVKHILMAFTQR